jgi:hypothetical protein
MHSMSALISGSGDNFLPSADTYIERRSNVSEIFFAAVAALQEVQLIHAIVFLLDLRTNQYHVWTLRISTIGLSAKIRQRSWRCTDYHDIATWAVVQVKKSAKP